MQALGFDVLGDQRVETRLVDRHVIDAQGLQLDGIDFYYGHF
jgi:hypothetical protein